MNHYINEIIRVNGTQYRGLDSHFYESCSVGDSVILKREPNNPYDKNAIAVILNGSHIGYIPKKEAAARLTPILDAGREYLAEVSQISPRKKQDIFRIQLSTYTKPAQKSNPRRSSRQLTRQKKPAFYSQDHYAAIQNAKSLCGIYRIRCKNSKTYVGQSTNIGVRWQAHIHALSKGFHSNAALVDDWAKLGPKQFRFEILEECPAEQLDDLEIYYIQKENSFYAGYNATIDGQSRINYEKFKNEPSWVTSDGEEVKNVEMVRDKTVKNRESIKTFSERKSSLLCKESKKTNKLRPKEYMDELNRLDPNAEIILKSADFIEWLNATPSDVLRKKSRTLDPSDGLFVLQAYYRNLCRQRIVENSDPPERSIVKKLKNIMSSIFK